MRMVLASVPNFLKGEKAKGEKNKLKGDRGGGCRPLLTITGTSPVRTLFTRQVFFFFFFFLIYVFIFCFVFFFFFILFCFIFI